MNVIRKPLLCVVVALLTAGASLAHADVKITEVAPWSSGNSPVNADWFELTNNGSTALNIVGWKMDDSSNSFASAVELRNISSIAAGQSVIFIESDAVNDAARTASFINTWFGSAAPADLLIGNYASSGMGVGLSTGGDGVSVFNASGALQAKVTFGASPSGPTFATFDNASGLNNTAISQLSVAGTNGAFVAKNDSFEIGSPGLVAAVPEPESYALLLAGLGLIGAIARKRKCR